MKQIVVIGGGAAGMMAAIAATGEGARVTLLEKNEKLGKKIYITGKGRCNVTNDSDVENLLAHVVTNRKFLYGAFYGFSSADMMALLEENGLKLKTERGNRVFPVSDHSSDVIACLSRMLAKRHVEVRLHTQVTELLLNAEKTAVRGVRDRDGNQYPADAVILATGGLSYPLTGSTGDGYKFAETCGHTVSDLRPVLVPLEGKEEWIRALQGLSLRNVSVTILDGKKKLYEEFGEMLFTHFGVSGPAVLSGSSYIAARLKEHPLTMKIDLKPALSEEQLDARILRDFEEAGKKQLKNSLGGLYPSKLIPVIIGLSRIPEEKRVNEIRKEERETLVRLTKSLTLTITGLRGYKEAIITQGGVNIKEVDPSTMESKMIRGLYLAGELLDLDAVTGGYNLQIAWSTGHAAGIAAASEI